MATPQSDIPTGPSTSFCRPLPRKSHLASGVLDGLKDTPTRFQLYPGPLARMDRRFLFTRHYLDFLWFLPREQAQDWGWTGAVHPDDLNGLAGSWRSLDGSLVGGEREARLLPFDGEYLWFHCFSCYRI